MANFRQLTSLRQTNEDYSAFDPQTGRGGNLAPLQRRYAQWWLAVRDYQVGRKQMECAAFGFKGRAVNGKLVPLGPESRIRTIESLAFLSIVPLPKQQFVGKPGFGNGRYRLHFSEQVGYVKDGDIHFGGKFVGASRINPAEHRQAALDKRPLQDHQIYSQVDYIPDGIGDQIVEAFGGTPEGLQLKAPIYGRFAVVTDELYLRLTIEGFDIYRFLKKDMELVKLVAGNGEVKKDDVLATLAGKVSYLVAEPWASKPDTRGCRPLIDNIEGDSLGVTHYRPQLSFAMMALEQMLAMDEGELGPVPSPEDCWPYSLVNVPTQIYRAKRQMGWEPNMEFKAALMEAVSPDAVGDEAFDDLFTLRSPCVGRIVSIVRHDGYKIVHIERDEDGKEVTVAAPICAEFYDNLETVHEDQPIGEYVQRCYYSSYDQLVEATQGCIVKIEDDFLDFCTIFSGETNWVGDGVLVDDRLAGSLREHCSERFVDTAPLLPYLDDEFGVATLPPFRYTVAKHGFQRRVNGILYDTTPVGSAFTASAAKPSPQKPAADADAAARKARNRKRKERRNRQRVRQQQQPQE
jgi:hypothetical protein